MIDTAIVTALFSSWISNGGDAGDEGVLITGLLIVGDHSVACLRLTQGETRTDSAPEMTDELSVSGAHASRSCCSTSLPRFVLVSGHHRCLSDEERG